MAQGRGDIDDRSDAGHTQRISPTLIQALNHPVRREALRLLHRSRKAQSATQLHRCIAAPGTTISYHLKVLVRLGAAAQVGERKVRGFPEKFFISEVSENRQVVAILADTAPDDDDVRRP